MPDLTTGTLTQEDMRRAIEWLDMHWGSTDTCPMHPSRPTSWGVEPQLVQTVNYGALAFQPGGKTYAYVVVVCLQCGFTALVNAVKMGLIPARP